MHGRAVGLIACVLASASAGCADTDRSAPQALAVQASGATEDAWTARSPAGTSVRLVSETLPLRPGERRFEIVIDPAPAPEDEVSVDLVSPSMLSHGIRRFAAVRLAGGLYEVLAEIPMEGRWLLYINLGDGAEAAEIVFDIAPGESEPNHGSSGTHSAVHH